MGTNRRRPGNPEKKSRPFLFQLVLSTSRFSRAASALSSEIRLLDNFEFSFILIKSNNEFILMCLGISGSNFYERITWSGFLV